LLSAKQRDDYGFTLLAGTSIVLVVWGGVSTVEDFSPPETASNHLRPPPVTSPSMVDRAEKNVE